MIMDNCTKFHNIDNFVHAFAVKSVFYVITIVIGLFGNILTVSTILKNKYLRTPMNISLVSLAFCDLIVCACVLPMRLLLYSGACDAPYTMVLCRVDVFLKSVCDYVQPSMLVATSFERYKSIAKPFENKGKVKRIVVVISVTWCTCLCCGAVSAVLFTDGATYFPCSIRSTPVQISARAFNFREGYVTLPFGISCIILVSIFYYLMIRTLHNHSKKMKKGLKARPFKNKVKPMSTKRSIKETKTDALTIEPVVVENNQSSATNNSRQQTRISVVQTDSSKDSPNSLHTVSKQDQQLLQVKRVINEDIQSVSTDNNPECRNAESVTYEAVTRRISFRKARDTIFLNETKTLHRLSVVAKHVVLLKSHKRKSLNNMHSRRAAGNAVNKHMNASLVSQETCTSKPNSSHAEKNNGKNTEIETEIENDGNREINQASSEMLKLSTPEVRESSKKNEPDNLASDKRDSSAGEEQTKPNQGLQEESSLTTESKQIIDNKSYTHRKNSIKSHCEHFDKDVDNDISEKRHATLGNNGENPTDENSGVCDTRKDFINSGRKVGDDNEIKPVGKTKENENVNAQERANDLVSDNKVNVKTKSDGAEEKPKVSNIDIVDFDGTVHKDVKVEGAVVGAVCVMNTTNRLEGRRKVEMRAAKRIAVMMGSFVLLWLPLPLISLFLSSRRQISSSDVEALLVSASISATTVAINPILNLLLNKQLRSAATSILRRSVNALKRIKLH